MYDPNNIFDKTIDPSGIKQPIQLLAVVLGIIVLSLITAAVYLSSIQIWLSSFSLISAVIITLLVIHNFLSILKDSPWVFHNPNDYGPGEYVGIIKKMMGDLQENLYLQSVEVGEQSKENIKKALHSDSLKIEIDKCFAQIANVTNENFDASENNEVYFNRAINFENLVSKCLIELKFDTKREPILKNMLRPDFIVTNNNGKKLPVEVKLFGKKISGNILPKRLFNQMLDYMIALNTDESILIISSEITPDALKLIEKLSENNKIHIVIGNTKEKLKPQLANILTN